MILCRGDSWDGMMSRRYVNIHIAGTFQKCSDWNCDDIGWLARASGISIQCNASMKILVSEAAYQEWLVFLFFSIIYLLPWNRYGWICLNKRTVLKLYCLLDYLPFILKHLPLLPFVFSLFSLINRNLTSPFTTTLKLLPLNHQWLLIAKPKGRFPSLSECCTKSYRKTAVKEKGVPLDLLIKIFSHVLK